ncbi:MAG: hypothetical protein ACTSQE_06050 [Candidatus Heimdallarchaeaceae archaeon]
MKVSWGYNHESPLSHLKYVGSDISSIKQVFSSLLFRQGILGAAIKLAAIKGQPRVEIKLVVDDEIMLQSYFSPMERKEYIFTLEQPVIPKTKIEIIVSVQDGEIGLQTSSIGSGMGFQLQADNFVPSAHFPVGLIVSELE